MNAPQNGGEDIDVMGSITKADHYRPDGGVVYYLERPVE